MRLQWGKVRAGNCRPGEDLLHEFSLLYGQGLCPTQAFSSTVGYIGSLHFRKGDYQSSQEDWDRKGQRSAALCIGERYGTARASALVGEEGTAHARASEGCVAPRSVLTPPSPRRPGGRPGRGNRRGKRASSQRQRVGPGRGREGGKGRREERERREGQIRLRWSGRAR